MRSPLRWRFEAPSVLLPDDLAGSSIEDMAASINLVSDALGVTAEMYAAAMAAARAGKDAYVEKPLGISIEQNLLCRKLFREKKRIFQYGTQQRSDPKFRHACELARNGYLGELERKLVVTAHKVSQGAREKIEARGGEVKEA